jgi:hypothetical protein
MFILYTVAELELKFRCGAIKRDYTKLTSIYTIHICAMKNFCHIGGSAIDYIDQIDDLNRRAGLIN